MSRHTTLAHQLILSLLLVCSTYAGYITPISSNPIIASIANKNELSDYTFTLSPDTALAVGMELRITFPGQYRSGLGIPISPVCTMSCSVSDRTVIFVMDTAYASGSTVTVTIKDIENPETKGGTGNFKVSTYKGINVLDENAIFGTIGIANSVATLGFPNVVLDTGSSSNTGENAYYAFSFKVTQIIPAGSLIKLTVSDTGFTLASNPVCNVFAINAKIIQGTFTCTTVNRDIIITGLSADIPALQDVGIRVNMTNPSVAGETQTFAIAILRGSTNVIFDRRADIPGVTITPSSLKNVALTPVDTVAIQAKNKVMDYTLVFTLKNPLQLGAAMSLTFSSDFAIDPTTSSAHFVNYGLEDISESSPLVMAIDYDNNIITLSNFKAVNASTQISLQVRLQNPPQSGTTGMMTIYTYADTAQTQTVDADLTSAFTTIATVESPTSYSITTQSLVVSTLQTQVEFLFRPSSTVVASGILKIRVPSSFTVGSLTASACQINSAGGSYVSSSACSITGGVISLTLPGTTAFPSGTDNYFSFNSVITTPTANGTYLFDVTTYQTDGTTVIESWTAPLTVVAAAFTTNTATTLVVGAGLRTILTFTYQPSVTVPAGVTQTTTNDTKGVLEFEFSGVANDLGTGQSSSTASIPCKPLTAAITPTTGQLKCTLTPGASPVIRVDNFPQITAGASVSIAFPKLSNPSPAPSGNAFTVKVKTYKIKNRIRTDLNTGSVSIAVQTAGALTESGTITNSNYAFTNNAVLATTDLNFKPGTTNTLTGPGTILVELPTYGNGYIPYPNSLTCKLATTTVPCVGYEGADWVAITLSSTFATNTAITISGLKVPLYSTTLYVGPTFRYILTSSQQETVNRPQQVFPAASVPAFTTGKVIASNQNLNAINVDYTFTFVSPNPVPQGSSIYITFPSAYNILASKPAVTFSSTTLVAANSTGISFTRSYSQVIISNFQAIAASATITLKVSGVKNPTGVTQSTGWNAEIRYSTGSMLYSASFDQFNFATAAATGTLAINSISVFPLNAQQVAEYNITITPQTPIPVNGEIQVIFPSANYLILPSPPKCKVTGAFTTYSKCALHGSKIVITLDTAYTTGTIKLTLSGISNPVQGTTLPFIVQTYYDNTLLDDIDSTVTTGRTVTFTSAPTAITMQSLTFAPQNEGEPATYTFSFLPTTTLTTDMYIKIIFPDVYDNNLGSRVSCGVTAGLTGNFLCGVDRRVVTITGFSEYTPSSTNPITLNIYNVINPNQNLNSDTKQFTVATIKKTGTSYVDINTMAGTLETLVAPGWAYLWSITSTNANARTSADYTFNFTTFDKIPKLSSGGEVRIALPVEFEMNDKNLTCEPQIDDYATDLTCSIERNNIIVKGNAKDYGGNVIFIVKGITNPVSQGVTTNIQVKVYDNFNQKIVERTFPNLDVFAQSYVWPGPLIYVNGDNPLVIERGTQTNDLFITTDYPSALNLSISPTTPGFSIIPFYIDFPLGKASSKFRMSVDESFALGTYYVQWTTLGELIPPYYTPLRRTQVTIVANKDKVVSFTSINPIPRGGNSLPITFSVPNGPNLDLGIAVTYLTDYPGITLSTSTVSFRAGQEQATLTVYAQSGTPVAGGSLVLSLTGSNADVYNLQNTMINFTVVAPITTTPTINAFTVNTILSNSVSFSITASDACMVYYMLALRYTDQPSLQEAINLGPAPYTSTESRYGSIQINDNTVPGSITISSLVAETEYVIYVYIVDRAGNSAGPINKIAKTLNRYNAAEFQLQFTQASLNAAEKQVAINAVAFLLSLNPSQVQEKKYTTRRLQGLDHDGGNGETRRFLEQDNSRMLATSVVTLQIMPVPDSLLYPSPLVLALSLNSKRTQLNDKLKNFDPTFTITATEFTRYKPGYSVAPAFVSTGTDYAVFNGQLNNYGRLYVVCVKDSEDSGTPTSYQVWKGLSSNNVKNPSAAVEVSAISQTFTMTVTDLDDGSNYNAYVVGGSAHPGFPDLMTDDQVKKLSFKTNEIPKITTTKKKFAMVNTVSGMLMGLLCLVFLL